MYALIKMLPVRRLLSEQVPSLAISLFIAEIAYKFHSFLLETLAFLATWYVVDAIRHLLVGLLQRQRNPAAQDAP